MYVSYVHVHVLTHHYHSRPPTRDTTNAHQVNATCTADADNDGFEFDMDDGETSGTASNKVGGYSLLRV